MTGFWKDFFENGEIVEDETGQECLEDINLAVDVSLWLNESVKGAVKYQNPRNIDTSHLATILKRVVSLLCAGVKPLVVFDGKPPEEKLRGQSVIAKKVQAESKNLLDLLDIAYIDAPEEAEAQCAQLEMDRLVDGTITRDGDYFLFGGRYLYTMDFKRTYPENVKRYTVDSILQHFECRDRDELILLAMLTGCDYQPKGVKKVGIKKAVSVIKEFRDEEKRDRPINTLKRFRDHCQEMTDTNGVPNSKKSRWQKLSPSFSSADFPSEKVFSLYQKPVVYRLSDLPIKSNWSESVPLVPRNKEALVEFCQKRIGWLSGGCTDDFFASNGSDLEESPGKGGREETRTARYKVERLIRRAEKKEKERTDRKKRNTKQTKIDSFFKVVKRETTTPPKAARPLRPFRRPEKLAACSSVQLKDTRLTTCTKSNPKIRKSAQSSDTSKSGKTLLFPTS